MPTPAEIIDMAASLQNDTAQDVYTDAACLPYFNMALRELQEIFELNNVPVTNQVSAVLPVAAGVSTIKYQGTVPLIPSDLIEIRRLWESPTGLNQWTEVFEKEFIPQYWENGNTISQFLIYAWIANEIKLIAANADNDLKIDYMRSLFSAVPIGAVEMELGVHFKNIFTYLGFETAALCSMFIGENETRASALEQKANASLNVSVGISTKGRQSIVTRRRPFRSSYKRRNNF